MAEQKQMQTHTPGPWAWFGNARTNSLYLATRHSGRRYVMGFTRWGLNGAQPRFQPGRGIMVDAKHLLQFEVGDQSIVGIDQAKKDTSVYRYDVRGIDCADARLIAAAPDMYEAARPLADLVEHFSGSDDEQIAVTVGELRALAAALRRATGAEG